MIEPKYRTFGRRSWACVVDSLVFLPLAVANFFIASGDGVPIWLRSVWYVGGSFSYIAYRVIMHARYGQTLGKMATGVKVLDISGFRLSGRQAFLGPVNE
jgi:uncharacterized RDD family membrane protein YckC